MAFGVVDKQKVKKRICINIDGTWMSADNGDRDADSGEGVTPSNATRIGRATLGEDPKTGMEQIVYYQSGVGTNEDFLNTGISGMTGNGLRENLREAYGFLANNYDVGDEIYITGYSRGAYQARSLAGLIGKVGILTKKGMDKFYSVFDKYEKEVYIDVKAMELAGETRKNYRDKTGEAAKPITIKAVAVWETVGALGIPYWTNLGNWATSFIKDYSFHDVKLGKHMENAFHALALNEHRDPYTPTLWENPKSSKVTTVNYEQCWFVGDHAGVGGGWDDTGTADISLAWMMSRLEALGLAFDKEYIFRVHEKSLDYYTRKKKLPRQWAEGQTYAEAAGSAYVNPLKLRSKAQRSPMQYDRVDPDTTNWIDEALEETNETIHPSVRYRLYGKNEGKKLGAYDKADFNPGGLFGWSPPLKDDAKGFVGAKAATVLGPPGNTAGSAGTATPAPKPKNLGANLEPKSTGKVWTKLVPKVEVSAGSFIGGWGAHKERPKRDLNLHESDLGYYEQLLLALYDQQTEEFKGVWKAVLGEDGPPAALLTTIKDLQTAKDGTEGLKE
ncbi:MAG: hypothetical protein M1833_000852 [Piccolia ochrophora]|nr:MAG: hypothetical protein M1833_000852 [Piccolia ochrophora]